MSAAERPPAGPEPEDMPTPADRLEAEAERARRGDDARAGGPEPLGAERARQGRIALDTPTRRRVFLSGLVGLAILVIVVVLIAALS